MLFKYFFNILKDMIPVHDGLQYNQLKNYDHSISLNGEKL